LLPILVQSFDKPVVRRFFTSTFQKTIPNRFAGETEKALSRDLLNGKPTAEGE
jgi:hypothetical protein